MPKEVSATQEEAADIRRQQNSGVPLDVNEVDQIKGIVTVWALRSVIKDDRFRAAIVGDGHRPGNRTWREAVARRPTRNVSRTPEAQIPQVLVPQCSPVTGPQEGDVVVW